MTVFLRRHAAVRERHELEGSRRGGLQRGLQLRREHRVQCRRGREGEGLDLRLTLTVGSRAEINNNNNRRCCCLQFIQWNIHRCGVKQSEQDLPQDATGPFVLSGYSGYKQVQVPRGRLIAFDSEGQHVLTCSSSGGLIYRVRLSPPVLLRCAAGYGFCSAVSAVHESKRSACSVSFFFLLLFVYLQIFSVNVQTSLQIFKLHVCLHILRRLSILSLSASLWTFLSTHVFVVF